MAVPNVLIVAAEESIGRRFESEVLLPPVFDVTFVASGKVAVDLIKSNLPDLVFISTRLMDGDGIVFGQRLAERLPALPLILVTAEWSEAACIEAQRQGFWDCLPADMPVSQVEASVSRCLERRQRLRSWAVNEASQKSRGLKKRIQTLDALHKVGQTVNSSLDLDTILSAVVDAAVEMTGAEEGSLLLLDNATGELYMRAARNFQEDFVRTFRLPVHDSLAGQAIRTGQVITFDQAAPKKIKTSYLVHTLVYVPLQIQHRTIGVLGIDNRQGGHPFQAEHISLMSTLADYAAIAIENAHAYASLDLERKKLELILTKVEDCVIVVEHDGRLIIANQAAQKAFGLQGNLAAQPVVDLIRHQDLLDIFQQTITTPYRSEIQLDDGRVFNAQVTPIPEIGTVVTMQDITHLKELDRIKSEFVSTVSHDLRSPLTAILGYVELISRVGPVNEQQKEFIARVQVSVHNITSLINDLLDLGRIEAGFDARKELIPFGVIVNSALEGLALRISEKSQQLTVNIPPDLPTVMGNPVRLRQMVANLVGNAVKYTPPNGRIAVLAHCEAGQIILQITDNGPGIPASDQPYIFEKFYRASNVPNETPGSGLGLAIVKSIIDNHGGRIWVESSEGYGTTFTVVLPVSLEKSH